MTQGVVKKKWFLCWLASAGLLVLLLVVGIYLYRDYQALLNEPLQFSPDRQHYTIRPGSSLGTVLAGLQQRRILTGRYYRYYLQYAAWRRGLSRRIQAGEYRIESGVLPVELLEQFARGATVQHRLTLVEGWRFRDVMRALRAHPALEHTLADDRPETVLAALAVDKQGIEGLFLADTWYFPRGSSDVSVLRRAHHALLEYLQAQWQERAPNLPYDSPEQALIMASIIEKETARAGERARIAGVFIRRLQRGMKLQSDPTVIFAMGDAFQGNIGKRDLAVVSPYNTYLHRGLPPTPIALSGAAAIHAALHPTEEDSLYFVARGDGSHQFSASLGEHNRAVRKYQLRR